MSQTVPSNSVVLPMHFRQATSGSTPPYPTLEKHDWQIVLADGFPHIAQTWGSNAPPNTNRSRSTSTGGTHLPKFRPGGSGSGPVYPRFFMVSSDSSESSRLAASRYSSLWLYRMPSPSSLSSIQALTILFALSDSSSICRTYSQAFRFSSISCVSFSSRPLAISRSLGTGL